MKTRYKSNICHFLLLVFIPAFFAGGCTPKVPVGKWEVAPDVQKVFEAGTILPNHTYYYLGSYSGPGTVIAINNHYALHDTNVWAKVDEMSEKLLREWLTFYRTEGPGAFDYYGGVILTPDGQQAGIWYSRNVMNIVQMPESGVLEIFQPHTPSGATYDIQGGNSEGSSL